MKIGFIGTGIMGFPMAKRLLAMDGGLAVYNRTPEKAKPLIEMGASLFDSPAALANNCQLVFSMVSNDSALTVISEEVMKHLPPEGMHVDCSTVSGLLTSQLENTYASHNRIFLHSPVLGSYPQAESGTLLLFVGGNKTISEKITPILKAFGQTIWYFEKAEQATYTKLIMNSFIAGMAMTLIQGLMLATKTGVGGKIILDILQHSAMNAQMFQTKGTSILDRNFTPRFFVENLLKDVNLMISEADRLQSPAYAAKSAKTILENAVAMGLAKEDYIAIAKVIEQEAGAIIK
jgi:3-hydroxyisobutyrate dehydrogenase